MSSDSESLPAQDCAEPSVNHKAFSEILLLLVTCKLGKRMSECGPGVEDRLWDWAVDEHQGELSTANPHPDEPELTHTALNTTQTLVTQMTHVGAGDREETHQQATEISKPSTTFIGRQDEALPPALMPLSTNSLAGYQSKLDSHQ